MLQEILKRTGLILLGIILWAAARLLIPAFSAGAMYLSPWYIIGFVAVVLLFAWIFNLLRKAW